MLDSLARAIYHTLKAARYWAFGEPWFVTVTGEDGGKHRIDTRAIKVVIEWSPLPKPIVRVSGKEHPRTLAERGVCTKEISKEEADAARDYRERYHIE